MEKDKDKAHALSSRFPTYSLLLGAYFIKLSPSEYVQRGIGKIVDPLSLLDILHRSNPCQAQLAEAEVHAKDLRYIFSTSTRGKLNESATTLAVTPICTLLHQLSIKSRMVQCTLGLDFPSYQTSSLPSYETLSEIPSFLQRMTHLSSQGLHNSSICQKLSSISAE